MELQEDRCAERQAIEIAAREYPSRYKENYFSYHGGSQALEQEHRVFGSSASEFFQTSNLN